jgi:SsrA-binding protein
MKVVNRKAYYDYNVLESYIAGIMLQSSEVKSVAKGDFNFNDSFIHFKDGELWIKNWFISKYKPATYNNHDEVRDRKILLSKKEINRISDSIDEKGITIIPLEIFPQNGKFKLKLGVCRGKKNFDKRESIKKRDLEREYNRNF